MLNFVLRPSVRKRVKELDVPMEVLVLSGGEVDRVCRATENVGAQVAGCWSLVDSFDAHMIGSDVGNRSVF